VGLVGCSEVESRVYQRVKIEVESFFFFGLLGGYISLTFEDGGRRRWIGVEKTVDELRTGVHIGFVSMQSRTPHVEFVSSFSKQCSRKFKHKKLPRKMATEFAVYRPNFVIILLHCYIDPCQVGVSVSK
jgi:hypothetical protein